ncbi:polysaccharide deacetylase family protein [Pelagibacterium montanilacus]|uniref:polysaccharide deacetylase family protein n=1 Tax=Pelagibacterium montanilacus TaxID=2185280 RepID=UPI000F8D0B2D|nr:polysaccharide deacetylase family protein [Pelagibacterium montanilacus]
MAGIDQRATSLAGRTLIVGERAGIALAPGEVVLTFDDGPRPERTEAVLDALGRHEAKAVFFMLGRAARAHPGLVRAVAADGHTIGSHTYDHARLTELSPAEAMAEVQAGHEAVAEALGADGAGDVSRFFRFPYLAYDGVLRTAVADGHLIELGVDIDSKDYYSVTASELLQSTLDALERKGRGVILFHDIHARTVAMLPDFLAALAERGYSVVSLKSTDGSVFDTPLVTAGL